MRVAVLGFRSGPRHVSKPSVAGVAYLRTFAAVVRQVEPSGARNRTGRQGECEEPYPVLPLESRSGDGVHDLDLPVQC